MKLSAEELMQRKDVAMFAPLISSMEDEELFAAKKAVLGLIEHPGWGLVQEIIDRAVERSQLNLRYADVRDHASQSRDIGFQAGMDTQKSVARAVLEVAQRREEKIAENLETEGKS